MLSLGEDVQVVDDVAAIAKERKLGKLNVIRVRTNTDLLIGDALKKTGAGNPFFVRHCYPPGGCDWYKSLKKALKAEIDEATWDSLNKTVSRAFAKLETGKITV